MVMKRASIGWLYTLEDRLHPKKLNEYKDYTILHRMVIDLEEEIKGFRPYFVTQLGNSEKVARTSLVQLIQVSNAIYVYLTKISPSWNTGRFSHHIRNIYLHILSLLGSLIEMSGTSWRRTSGARPGQSESGRYPGR